MTLKIISSECVLFDGEVTSVTLPGVKGRFQVLKNHAALISTLAKGKITYQTADGKTEEMDVPGGIADVDNNVIQVCLYK